MPVSPESAGHRAPVLLICEQGAAAPDLGPLPCATLHYRFVEEYPDDGFAGWERDAGDDGRLVDVAAHCRACTGGFARQGLNRSVGQALIREKPSAVVIVGLYGCTVDLPRIADMMGVPAVMVLDAGSVDNTGWDDATRTWVADALGRCSYLVGDPEIPDRVRALAGDRGDRLLAASALVEALADLAGAGNAPRFSYSTYEFVLRDHPLLAWMQTRDVRHFAQCERVLDVACGAGIFLECLRAEGVQATGVERDSVVAEYARGMGCDVINEDALAYLDRAGARYDGIYCSHFVEHLPVDGVEKLLRGLYDCTTPGGTVVLVFPDPESIRSQLLGFWRDPEHVRFYHPDLIASMAVAGGFTLEWSSYDEQPHEAVPFATEPPPLPDLDLPHPPAEEGGDSGGFLADLGLGAGRHLQRARDEWRAWARDTTRALQQQQAYLQALERRTDALWQVSRTWAWNDNATLRLRRGADSGR